MDTTRKFVERDQLTSLVRATFGPTRRLNTVARLRGGSKKGVYRLIFDDEPTAILYFWDAAENYWPTPQDGTGSDRADPFSDASSIDLFDASHACLNAIGVRTPRVYFLDRSRSHFPAEIAVVEDVRGGTLEARLQHDPQDAEQTLVRLGGVLQAMRQHRGRYFGKVALKGLSDARHDRSCEQIVLDRAVQHLAEAALRVERVAQVREQLEEKIRELASVVRPRDEYSLIHGELGPDHVLVDEQGDPVIIDTALASASGLGPARSSYVSMCSWHGRYAGAAALAWSMEWLAPAERSASKLSSFLLSSPNHPRTS